VLKNARGRLEVSACLQRIGQFEKTGRRTGVFAFVGNQIQYRKKRVKNMAIAKRK
jgi:hypothetical protein